MKLFSVLSIVLAFGASIAIVSCTKVSMKGYERRALRAISNRLKQDLGLVVLQCDESPSENFMSNLQDVLKSREMVQIRADVQKKKEAKELGSKLAEDTCSELVQVLGHTILLYRSCGPQGVVTKLLADEVSKGDYANSE